MVLQVVLAALLVAGGAPIAAEPLVRSPEAEAGTAVYVDDLDTTVVSPRARAGATFPAGLEVDAHWTADVISSASVDIVTTASRMQDVRNEVGIGVRRENLVPALDADLGYAYSVERDAYSHTMQGGLRWGLLERNLELALRLGSSFNRLGDVAQPVDAWGTLWVHDLELGATLLVDARTVVEIAGSGFLSRGFQASPYRRVPIVTGTDLGDADWLPEDVPDERLRGTATLRARRALGARWVLAGEYRLYADDWGVIAHTESLEAALDVTTRVTLRARQRGTVQSRARFYRARYDSAEGHRTRDRRLAPSESISAGLALEWNVGPIAEAYPLDLLLSVDGLAWHFSEFLAPWPSFSAGTELRPLTWVRGLVGQLDVRAQW